MRASLAIALSMLASPALCADGVEGYLAIRDAAVAKVTALEAADSDGARKAERLALRTLSAKLQVLIEPVTVEGFSGKWTVNLDSLLNGDVDFGHLDGLASTSADGKTRLIITTATLLQHWLREHQTWWEAPLVNVPVGIREAIASDAFYTQAIQTNAAVSRYVELPTTNQREGVLTYAMLAGRSQAPGPWLPNEVLVTVVHGDRVLLVTAPAGARIGRAPTCQGVWDAAMRRKTTIERTYVRLGSKDADLLARATKAEEDGEVAYRRCLTEVA